MLTQTNVGLNQNTDTIKAEKLWEAGNELLSKRPLFNDPNDDCRLTLEVLKLFDEAARLGHVGAKYSYFNMVIFAKGAVKDTIVSLRGQAITFLKEAAAVNHPEALFDLYRYYNEGRPKKTTGECNYGIPQDSQQADAILKRLKEIKLPAELQTQLDRYLIIYGVMLASDIPGAAKKNVDTTIAADAKNAEMLWKEGNKILGTLHLVVDPYAKNRGILFNAITVFEKAAHLGHVGAKYKYCNLIISSQSDVRAAKISCRPQAIQFLKDAAEQNHPEALFDLYRYYNEGRPETGKTRCDYGISQDSKQANLLLQRLRGLTLDSNLKARLDRYVGVSETTLADSKSINAGTSSISTVSAVENITITAGGSRASGLFASPASLDVIITTSTTSNASSKNENLSPNANKKTGMSHT